METYEVCYNVGDGIYSTNMIEGGKTTATVVANHHAKRFGYSIEYMHEINEAQRQSNLNRGMPLIDAYKFLEKMTLNAISPLT